MSGTALLGTPGAGERDAMVVPSEGRVPHVAVCFPCPQQSSILGHTAMLEIQLTGALQADHHLEERLGHNGDGAQRVHVAVPVPLLQAFQHCYSHFPWLKLRKLPSYIQGVLTP